MGRGSCPPSGSWTAPRGANGSRRKMGATERNPGARDGALDRWASWTETSDPKGGPFPPQHPTPPRPPLPQLLGHRGSGQGASAAASASPEAAAWPQGQRALHRGGTGRWRGRQQPSFRAQAGPSEARRVPRWKGEWRVNSTPYARIAGIKAWRRRAGGGGIYALGGSLGPRQR